jgi:biopolymer transport protein ExbD
MWRVALSMVAVLVDVLFVLLAGIGMSQTSVQIDLPPAEHSAVAANAVGSGYATADAALGIVAVLALLGFNILAILFGARLKLPGNRAKAVSAVFE